MTDTLDKLKKAFDQTISSATGVSPWNEPLVRRDAVRSSEILSVPIVQGGLGGWVGSAGFPYTSTTSDIGLQSGAALPARNSFEMGLGLPGVPDVDFVPYAAGSNRFGGKGPALIGHPISWEVVGPTLKSPYCDWQWKVDRALNQLLMETGPYSTPGGALPVSVNQAYNTAAGFDDIGGLYVLFTFTGEGFTGSLTGRSPITATYKSKAPYELFRVATIVGLQINLRSEKLLTDYYGAGDGTRGITLVRPKVTRLAAFPVPVVGQVKPNRVFVFLPPERTANTEYAPPYNTSGASGSWFKGGYDVTGTNIAADPGTYGTPALTPIPRPIARLSAVISTAVPSTSNFWCIEIAAPNALIGTGAILRVSNVVESSLIDSTTGTAANAFGFFEVVSAVGAGPVVVTLARVTEANPDTGAVFYGSGPVATADAEISIEVFEGVHTIFTDANLNMGKLAAARLSNLIDPRTSGPSVTYRDIDTSPVVASTPDRAIFDTRIGSDPGNLLELGFRTVLFPAKKSGLNVLPDFDYPVDANNLVLDPDVNERQYIEIDYSAGVAYLSHTPAAGNPLCSITPNGTDPINTTPTNNPRQEVVLYAACVPYSTEEGQTGSGLRIMGSSPESVDAGLGESDFADVFGRRIITAPNAAQSLNPVGFASVETTLTDLSALPPSGFFFVCQAVSGVVTSKIGPYYYQYTDLTAGPPAEVRLNGITGPSGLVALDPALGWSIVLQRSLRSFTPTSASADTVRGAAKRVTALAFKNTTLSFGADGTVTLEPVSTSTLDSAYRAGLTSTPGIGRVIVSDGGPIETRPEGSSLYADPLELPLESHFFSNYNLGIDTTESKVGFDFVGRRSNTIVAPYSGLDNFAGFIDRRVFAPQTPGGYTILGDLPSGSPLFDVDVIAASRISLDTAGNQFHDGTADQKTLLVNDLDLIHLPGVGVFLLHLPVVSTATDYDLVNLDGSVPVLTFPLNVKSCTVYRPRFMTGKGFDDGPSPITGTGGTWITGQGEKPALRVLAGSGVVVDGPDEGGSITALEFWYRALDRIPQTNIGFDTFGRLTSTLRPIHMPDADVTYRGNFLTRSVGDQALSADLSVGHLVEDKRGNVNYSYDFLSLRAYTNTTYAFTVVDVDRISIAVPPTVTDLAPGLSLFVELTGLTPTVPAENGLYVCQFAPNIAPPPVEFTLRKLGDVPSLTIADTGTAKFYIGSFLGKYTDGNYSSTPSPTYTSTTYTPTLSLGVAPDANAVGLVINGPDLAGRPNAAAFRVLGAQQIGNQVRAVLRYTVDFLGNVDASGAVAAEDYLLHTPISRSVVVPMKDGYPKDTGGTPDWDLLYVLSIPHWEGNVVSGELLFPLHIPNYCSIVNVLVVVSPKFVVAATANRMQAQLLTLDHDFTTPAAPTMTSIGQECDNGAVAIQTLNLRTSPNLGSGFLVDQVVTATAGTKEWFLRIRNNATSGAGDLVYSVQVQLALNRPSAL